MDKTILVEKAVKVIDSCKTIDHIMGADRYIANLRKIINNETIILLLVRHSWSKTSAILSELVKEERKTRKWIMM